MESTVIEDFQLVPCMFVKLWELLFMDCHILIFSFLLEFHFPRFHLRSITCIYHSILIFSWRDVSLSLVHEYSVWLRAKMELHLVHLNFFSGIWHNMIVLTRHWINVCLHTFNLLLNWITRNNRITHHNQNYLGRTVSLAVINSSVASTKNLCSAGSAMADP